MGDTLNQPDNDFHNGRRAVLWDLDGTLIDTAPFHWMAWRDMLASINVMLTWEDFLPTFGMRNDTIIPMWFGKDVSAEDIIRIGDKKEAHYRELLGQQPIQPLPGAVEWITALRQRGWQQAIATMTPRANVDQILDRLDIRNKIDGLVTAEDVARGKPEPDVFLAAARLLNVPPSVCVVVEDSEAGIEAARRAGMRSIGVRLGLPAGLVVDRLDRLPPDAFDQLLKSL